jgi:hypothetical protein
MLRSLYLGIAVLSNPVRLRTLTPFLSLPSAAAYCIGERQDPLSFRGQIDECQGTQDTYLRYHGRLATALVQPALQRLNLVEQPGRHLQARHVQAEVTLHAAEATDAPHVIFAVADRPVVGRPTGDDQANPLVTAELGAG